MNGPHDVFRINLNQNLWGLIVAFVSLGSAEYFNLGNLFWFAFALAVIMMVSITITTFAYTVIYLRNRGWLISSETTARVPRHVDQP
jgi:hypothetical protein